MGNLFGKLFSVSCIVLGLGLPYANAFAEEQSMIDYCKNKLADGSADTAFCSGYLKGHDDGYREGRALVGYAGNLGNLGRLITGPKSATSGKEVPVLVIVPSQGLDLSNANGNGVVQQLQQQLNSAPGQ